jgi:hypothetical protein
MREELRPWEVAKMIEEAGGPVELEVWNDQSEVDSRYVTYVLSPAQLPYTVEGYWYAHARLPQKPERRKITDRYRLMKRCRELDAQGNGILVRSMNGEWCQSMFFGFFDNPKEYQYIHLDDNGQPTGEPQDFWE